MPGPAPKPDSHRARRNAPTKAVVAVVVPPARPDGDPPPGPPPGLTLELEVQWYELWDSPLAHTISDTDRPALRRLFTLRAQQAVLFEKAAEAGYLAEGSTGQETAHPALKAALSIESAIVALEDRFGLTTKSRQAIGIGIGQLADAAKRHPEVFRQEETPRADPRLADPRTAPPDPRT